MGQKSFRLPRSFAGAAVAALGTFVLYDNLHAAAAQLQHFLGTTGGQALGALPTVLLAAARVTHAYASSHQRFVEIFFQHLLLSCWPLLLIILGMAWSQDSGTETAGTEKLTRCQHQNNLPEKSVVRVDFSIHRSTCN